MGLSFLGTVLFVSSLCLNGYFLLLSLVNIRFLHRHTREPEVISDELVSIIVPVRDEEVDLPLCLETLLVQDYPNIEIIVVNDGSRDDTWAVMSDYASRYVGIQAVNGKPLPSGWTGKNWALHQASQIARGRYLFFVDADTRHAPDSVSFAVTNLIRHRAGLISGYPRNPLGTLGERVTVSLMYMMTSMLLPLPLTTRTSAPGLSFAIGQFLAVNADDYTSTGGHAAISEQFQDDIKLARSFKASGKRVIFLDAKERVMCRMYIGFRESFRGISRNIFAYLDKNPAKLFGIYLLTFLGIFYPLGNLAASILRREPALLPAVTVILFATAWYLNLKDRGQDILSIFLYPITFLNLIIMGTYSMMKTGLAGAGIAWKGRQVK